MQQFVISVICFIIFFVTGSLCVMRKEWMVASCLYFAALCWFVASTINYLTYLQ